MKPRSTEPGPPFWKAAPELTNSPAPIAPPLYGQISIVSRWDFRSLNLHRNHLHVSALQILMQHAPGCDRLVLWVTAHIGLVARGSGGVFLRETAIFFVFETHCRGRVAVGDEGRKKQEAVRFLDK